VVEACSALCQHERTDVVGCLWAAAHRGSGVMAVIRTLGLCFGKLFSSFVASVFYGECIECLVFVMSNMNE
jgi:hypothetical protein